MFIYYLASERPGSSRLVKEYSNTDNRGLNLAGQKESMHKISGCVNLDVEKTLSLLTVI